MTAAAQRGASGTEELVRAYLTGGRAAQAEALAEDVRLDHPWGEFRGRDAVVAVSDEVLAAFPDREIEVTDLFARDGRAAARTIWRATHTGRYRGAAPTGQAAEVVTFHDVRAEGGRIASIVAVTDSLHVFQQLGLFPPATTLPAPLAYGALLRQRLFRDHGESHEAGVAADDGLRDDPASPTGLTRRFLEAGYVEPDPEALAALVDEDAVVHYHTSDIPLQGRAEVVAVVENLRRGFPDMTVVPQVILGQGDRAIHVSDWLGTQTARFQGIPPTGRRVKVKVAGRIGTRDGRIVEVETVLDSVSVLYQLGMLPRMDPIPRPLRPLLGLRARMQKRG